MDCCTSSYLPVDCDFYDELALYKTKNKPLKIFYFNDKKELEQAEGDLKDIFTSKRAEYASVGGEDIRLDKIITYDGRPGPAYDEYDAFSNECLDCRQDFYDD